jgi:hypothetical protein
MNGNCKLCQQNRELRRSHIIPEFCYKPTYEPTIHRATMLQAEPNRESYVQKGQRDHLLCDDCEQFLNKNYENPFNSIWFDGAILPDPVPESASSHDEPIMITGLDYTSFKLFHLSILWRASVATGDSFNTVNLGPYEEKIRQMLLTQHAGPADHYVMFGLLLMKDHRRVCYGVVSKPQQSRYGYSHAYYACYAGVEWNFIVTDHPGAEEKDLMRAALRLDGSMPLLPIPLDQSGTARIFSMQRGNNTAKF